MKKELFFESQATSFKEHAQDVIEDINFDVLDFAEKLQVEFKSIEELKKFNPDYLHKFLEDAKAKLMGNIAFIPKSIKDQFNAQFERTEADCLPLVIGCQKSLKEISNMGLKLSIENGKATLDEKQLDAKAKEFATYTFSDAEAKYYEKIENAAKALKEVYDFENENKMPHLKDVEKTLQPLSYKFNENIFFQLING